jgi:phage baseplate assembly protein W
VTVEFDFPFHVDGRGRTATTGDADHLRDLIEQVLFTAPGERVMRPDFGSGLLALVFEPGGPELVATTQHLVQGALQQELGSLIAVDSVEVTQDEGTLTVSVSYVALSTQQRTSETFSRSVS